MPDEFEVLIDAPLVPDPDADEEMGPTDAEAIADEDLQGSRLLLTRRTAAPVKLGNQVGGLAEFLCTFQPAFESRFVWASLTLRLEAPEGIKLIDVAPNAINDDEPVQVTIDDKGKLGLKYSPAKFDIESGVSQTFTTYTCTVQGSGIGTSLARWDFRENPHKENGLGAEHQLVTTLSATGRIKASITVSARLARPGMGGGLAALRDLVMGPKQRTYDIEFEIPNKMTRKRSNGFVGLPFWFGK